ncbi:hypothetical protein, partial [uncultured Campylobacter sp.]|uniref:hypothetical protein n=1 Tax=uncultured Campylobacter sp. TaxID=218934 RepID=UPI0026264FC5
GAKPPCPSNKFENPNAAISPLRLFMQLRRYALKISTTRVQILSPSRCVAVSLKFSNFSADLNLGRHNF